MAQFLYKVIDEQGNVEEGSLEAENKFEIFEKFRATGKSVTSVKEVKENKFIASIKKTASNFGTIKTHDKIIFARNLGLMLKAGLSLSRTLSVLSRQIKNKKFKNIIQTLESEISKGKTLSESLAMFPKEFSKLFVSMVRAGEEGGKLTEALDLTSSQMERMFLIQRKIKGAMIYPAVILTLMVAIAILMLVYIVPTLTATFKELDVELPFSTRIIIGISDTLRDHYFLVFGGVAILVAFVIWLSRTAFGRRSWHWFILHAPIISGIAKAVNVARAARTLSSLLSSGVDYVLAIGIVEDVLQNSYYKEVLREAKEKVEKGEPISGVFLAHENLFPLFMGEMASVGEETGNLAEMFNQVASFYENEVEQKTKDMSTVIEPVLMIIIGAAVGFFAISMLSPTYSLVDAI